MIETIIRFIDAVTRLISAIIWPVVALVAINYLVPTLGNFLRNLKEGTLEGPGFKITAKSQAEATAAIASASVSQLELASSDPDAAKALQAHVSRSVIASASAVDALTNVSLQSTGRGKQILWVDDQPINNTFEKQAFNKLGFTVIDATSTAQALDILKNRTFNLIISDMGRPEGRRAGYDLLTRLKEEKIDVPFIIYSRVNSRETRAEAIAQGAFGSTNHPDELLHLAADALSKI